GCGDVRRESRPARAVRRRPREDRRHRPRLLLLLLEGLRWRHARPRRRVRGDPARGGPQPGLPGVSVGARGPLRESLTRDGEYAPDNAVYVLRPYPGPEHAAPDLKPYIADKGDPSWPPLVATDPGRFERWLADESFAKSWALSFRADGDLGLSLAFPLLIFKNVQDPLAGGWLVNRVYPEGPQ